jgi:hypothetical protein
MVPSEPGERPALIAGVAASSSATTGGLVDGAQLRQLREDGEAPVGAPYRSRVSGLVEDVLGGMKDSSLGRPR